MPLLRLMTRVLEHEQGRRIKDSLETAGLRTTAGFPPLSDYIPTVGATVVARVRHAGAIILGKTNLPTLSGDYQSSNPIFGRSNNPWTSI